MSYCYDYPRPSVTVDLILFALEGDKLRVPLVKRKHDPFAGSWAIPGGFIGMEETAEQSARREMREETCLEVPGPVALVGVFDEPNRDPRGRTISLFHGAVWRGSPPAIDGADDADAAAWHDPRTAHGLAFDHDTMLEAALAWLERGVAEGPLGLKLLLQEFDAEQVRALHRAVFGSTRAAPAWIKRLVRNASIEPLTPGEERFRAVPP